MFFSLSPTPTDGSLTALPAFEEFYASRAHATSVSQGRSQAQSRRNTMFTRGGLRPTKAALGDDERRVQMPLSRRTLWIGTALLILAAK
jgi:hypothetical protein